MHRCAALHGGSTLPAMIPRLRPQGLRQDVAQVFRSVAQDEIGERKQNGQGYDAHDGRGAGETEKMRVPDNNSGTPIMPPMLAPSEATETARP